MGNIHILPTEKPSRLYNCFGKLEIGDFATTRDGLLVTNQNIYITSDEKPKEGDWCLDKFNQRWKLEDGKLIAFDSEGIKRFSTDNILGHECKKIILTTDQDLIEDGVQAIDDNFLKWFVNNPSCIKVDVVYGFFNPMGRQVDPNDLGQNHSKCVWKYKIIIPQEEPKQETIGGILETLDTKQLDELDIFLKGVEWKDKQNKAKFSNEEVFNILMEFSRQEKTSSSGTPHSVAKWFEQYRKK